MIKPHMYRKGGMWFCSIALPWSDKPVVGWGEKPIFAYWNAITNQPPAYAQVAA